MQAIAKVRLAVAYIKQVSPGAIIGKHVTPVTKACVTNHKYLNILRLSMSYHDLWTSDPLEADAREMPVNLLPGLKAVACSLQEIEPALLQHGNDTTFWSASYDPMISPPADGPSPGRPAGGESPRLARSHSGTLKDRDSDSVPGLCGAPAARMSDWSRRLRWRSSDSDIGTGKSLPPDTATIWNLGSCCIACMGAI